MKKTFTKNFGFSLAEMMVVMVVLTLVLAAATPIITKRATPTITSSAGASSDLKLTPLGTVTSNITLEGNSITTGYFSNSTTVTLPAVTDTNQQTTCILDFTTASSGYPTITNSNVLWSDKSGGKAPTYSTAAVVQNQITFKSIFVGSTPYWEANYSYCSGT